MPPLTGPLKVRQKKARIWAQDPSGAVVIDGTTDRRPDAYVCTAPGGTWRITAADKRTRRGSVLIDPSGREVAIYETIDRKHSQLRLAGGETVPVTGKSLFMRGFTCMIGDLTAAQAPGFTPQRYFTLTFGDGVVTRPDAEAIAVMATWISENTIASLIIKSNMNNNLSN